MHPPKINQKDCFSNNKNLKCNFYSGNGFIDPRSISQDIKLVLKGFELIIIWGKPFFLRPPFSPPPRNSFWARTVSFFDRFQNTQEDILLQIRHVPNVFETSPFLSPCIAHHYLNEKRRKKERKKLRKEEEKRSCRNYGNVSKGVGPCSVLFWTFLNFLTLLYLFKGTNGRQMTYEIFHVYCIFYSGFICQTTVIFGTTKDGSLVLNTLASWNCFTRWNRFQNGANDMSECLTCETAFCKKDQNFV